MVHACDRAFRLCVGIGSFVSQHGSHVCWADWVATERFFPCVATGFGVGPRCFGSRQGPSCVATEFSLWVGFPCRDSRARCRVVTRSWVQ